MKRLCYWLVALLSVILLVTTPVAAESITDSVKRESQNFDPDQAAKQVEHKAEELMAFAQSGSKLYIASALIVFLVLLLGGLFSKKLVRTAFYFLSIAAVGYIILNYWPEIRDGFAAFVKWLFTDTGMDTDGGMNETASGV